MNHLLSGIPEERLTPEREADLARSGKPEDWAELVKYNLREGYYYARGCYQGRGLSEGDALAAAYDGLTAAAKNFQPDKIRYFAYSKVYIRSALSKIKRSRDVVRKGWEAEPLPLEKVDEDEESVDKPYVPARNVEPLPCVLADVEGICMREEMDRIIPLLQTVLDAREKMIIELNFLGGLNLREIAELLGVSRSDTHHAKQEALKKIRNHLMDQNSFTR